MQAQRITALLVISFACAEYVTAQPPSATYQRRASSFQFAPPTVWGQTSPEGFQPSPSPVENEFGGLARPPRRGEATSFQFQRPYPYHLDYYRMRYGGSYAPYHGFLYGTPKVFAPTQVHGGFGYPPYAPYGYGFPAESAPVDPPHHESPTASGAE